jgi:hypothetical protein
MGVCMHRFNDTRKIYMRINIFTKDYIVRFGIGSLEGQSLVMATKVVRYKNIWKVLCCAEMTYL